MFAWTPVCQVLEYCCAVLKDMLDQTPDKKFPVWQSHDYFTQLLEGLAYLHSRGELFICLMFKSNIPICRHHSQRY